MELRVVREPAKVPDTNKIEISEQMLAALAQTEPVHWDAFFYSLRLNVQARVLGAVDDRALVQNQAQLQYIEELNALFKKILVSKSQSQAFN